MSGVVLGFKEILQLAWDSVVLGESSERQNSMEPVSAMLSHRDHFQNAMSGNADMFLR